MAAKLKAVIFDVGGVLVSTPVLKIRQYEKDLNLPKGALSLVFVHGAPNNAFCRLERGEIPLSKFCNEFELECKRLIKEKLGRDLPGEFSALYLFNQFVGDGVEIHTEMIDAMKKIKQIGLKVGVVTNNWIDDINPQSSSSSLILNDNNNNIDVIIESCKVGLRKPDKRIYQLACQRLGVYPNEVIFLDDLGVNLKSAKEMGIQTILVRDSKTALTELYTLLPLLTTHTDTIKSKL